MHSKFYTLYIMRKIVWTLLLGLLLYSCAEKKQEKGAPVYKTMKVERSSQEVKAT